MKTLIQFSGKKYAVHLHQQACIITDNGLTMTDTVTCIDKDSEGNVIRFETRTTEYKVKT